MVVFRFIKGNEGTTNSSSTLKNGTLRNYLILHGNRVRVVVYSEVVRQVHKYILPVNDLSVTDVLVV